MPRNKTKRTRKVNTVMQTLFIKNLFLLFWGNKLAYFFFYRIILTMPAAISSGTRMRSGLKRRKENRGSCSRRLKTNPTHVHKEAENRPTHVHKEAC